MEYIKLFSLPSRSVGVKATLQVIGNSKLILLKKSIILEPSPSQSNSNRALFHSLLAEKILSQHSTRLYILEKDIEMSTFNQSICFCIGCNAPGNIIHWTVEKAPTKQRYKNLSLSSKIEELLHSPHIPQFYVDTIILLWNSPFFQIVDEIFAYFLENCARCTEENIFICILRLLPFTHQIHINQNYFEPPLICTNKYYKRILLKLGLLPATLSQCMNVRRINAKKEPKITLAQIQQAINSTQQDLAIDQEQFSKEEMIAFGLYKIITSKNVICLLKFIHSVGQAMLINFEPKSTHQCIMQ